MTKSNPISRSAFARTIAGSRLRRLASTGPFRGLFAVLLLLASFGSSVPLSAQTSSNPGVFIADFNHDGIPDVLVPSPSTSSFILSFGSVPFGTFSAAARSVVYPMGCTAVITGGVAIGDFNGDGIPDLALDCVSSQTTNSAYGIYVLLGAGDGSFIAQPVISGLSNLVAADFDRDGVLDLLAIGSAGGNDQSIAFLKGNADGTFGMPVPTALSSTVYTSAIALDLDADGYPDLALGNFSGSSAQSLDLFRNNHDGTFGTQGTAYAPTATVAVGTYPTSTNAAILAGDFFGSGLPDLAVIDTGATPGVFVVQNSSTDGFAFATAVKTAYPGLLSAAAASFTSAFSDLLVYDGANLTVLANDGTGTFSNSYGSLSVANTSVLYSAADANGDGHADLYVATSTASGTSLTVDFVSGSATATSAPFALASGTAALAAAWPGNLNFSGTSLTGSQTANPLATAISLTSSENPSNVGDAVTFTATVLPASSGTQVATGTVTFVDGTTPLGTSALSAGGVAVFATSTLGGGSHSISALYSGDSIFGASSLAAPLVQQVNALVPVLISITPNTALIGDPSKTITIAGSSLISTTVVQVNGTAIPTTYVNPTTLTAVVPATYFAAAGTLEIALSNPSTGSVSAALPLTVSSAQAAGTLTGPPTTAPGTQPTLTFTLLPYPTDIVATLTLSLKSSIASGATDPNVKFANGSTTFSFTIPAGTTTTPTIQLQAGTIAESITVTAVLTAGTLDVTPSSLAPVVIDVPAAVPTATTTTLTRTGDQLVVTVIGFSNTREIVKADFHFVAANGASLSASDFSPPVAGIFSTWFADADSITYGSGFTYTQNFTVSDSATNIGSVQVTLTNTVGPSTMETAQ